LGALGLIDIIAGPTDAGTVGLYPPLLEEYLARESSTSKRYAVRELLTAQGLPVPPGLIGGRRRTLPADNAILSRNLAAHWAATVDRMAGVWRSQPTAANAVALLAALLSAHRTAVDPAAVYAGTEPTDDPAVGAELAGWYAVHLALAGQDPQEAWHVLDQATVRYPEFGLYLRSVRRHLELMTDRVPQGLERAAADMPPLVRDSAMAVLMESSIAQGRTGAALEELDRVEPVVPRYLAHAEASRGLADVLHGEIDRGVAWALTCLEAAQREYAPGLIQAHGYSAALGMAIRGDLTRLDELVSYVLTITSTSTLHLPYHAGIVGLDSARVRWLGMAGAGAGSMSPASSAAPSVLPVPPVPPVLGGYGPFPFIDLGADPAQRPTAEGLWSMARSAASRGFTAAAVFALVEAAELGPDAEAFAAITGLLDDAGNPFLAALVDLADAMVRRDITDLQRAQDALEGFGAWLYVARAGIMRALVLREQGENVQAAQHADRLWAQVAASTTGAEGLFRRLARAVELSARQTEVATLAVEGWASGEIAGELVLSVRTVENHIFNAYRKIGVESRVGLRRAFTTWLRSGREQA
jgi:DNA-binding CsgD family transcriptional regulator